MTKLNEYRRVIGYSYLLYIVVIVPVSLMHELGHTAVCSAGGYQFRIWLDFRGGHSICYGILGDNSVIAAMGGIFGLIASFGILAIWYFFYKRLTPLAVIGLALALDQGLKIILEVFLQRLYSAGVFAIYFARKQRLVVIR